MVKMTFLSFRSKGQCLQVFRCPLRMVYGKLLYQLQIYLKSLKYYSETHSNLTKWTESELICISHDAVDLSFLCGLHWSLIALTTVLAVLHYQQVLYFTCSVCLFSLLLCCPLHYFTRHDMLRWQVGLVGAANIQALAEVIESYYAMMHKLLSRCVQ